MDEKFIRRFESFRNSLDSLAEAKQRDLSDSFVLSGTSAKFSITFDLAWKVMKDILVQYYAITGFVTGSPREVLRESFQANLITGDEWMDMLKVRNQLAHDYDGVDCGKNIAGQLFMCILINYMISKRLLKNC
ncbi:MAG: HI0074 family nucleotidyltransferase substrate-binding subunit [Ruminococcus sp.]